MRIAIQQPALPAYRAPLFRAISEALPEHEITVYFGSEEPALQNVKPSGFRGVYSQFRVGNFPLVGELRWHAAQWKVVDGQQADIVVLSWNVRALSFWAALARARVNRIPVALWGHGYSKKSRNPVIGWLRALPIRLSSAVIFYDHHTAGMYERSGLDQQKIFVAANGLDSVEIQAVRTAFFEKYPTRGQARESLGLGEGPVLMYLGRLQPENRLDLVIGSLEQVLNDYPSCKLVIIGSGEEEKRRLSGLIVSAGVVDSVVWAGARYNEEELAPWMMASDLFVYPCNVGLSIIHAFNYGIPAVLCEPLEAHNPEVAVVVSDKNAVLAKNQTAGALGSAILRALNSKAFQQRLSVCALESVASNFNISSMVDEFRRLFKFLS